MEINEYIVEAEKMAINYKKLYIIEQSVKNSISICENINNLYFHEFIPLLEKEFCDEKLKMNLYKLIKVRNKICHMKDLNNKEEELLNYCYSEIIL